MEDTEEKRSLVKPEKFIRDPETGLSKIDQASKESYVVLTAGDPKNPKNFSGGITVVYAKKANKYYRDAQCTTLYTDSEIAALGLPVPAIIADARRKLIDELMRAGTDFNKDDILDATAPQVLKHPA